MISGGSGSCVSNTLIQIMCIVLYSKESLHGEKSEVKGRAEATERAGRLLPRHLLLHTLSHRGLGTGLGGKQQTRLQVREWMVCTLVVWEVCQRPSKCVTLSKCV